MLRNRKWVMKTLAFLLAIAPVMIERRVSAWGWGEPEVPVNYKR